jgi:hypothetical protein
MATVQLFGTDYVATVPVYDILRDKCVGVLNNIFCDNCASVHEHYRST